MKVRLEVVNEKANLRNVPLKRDAVVGRSADCDLRIVANGVSRRHCRILLAEDAVYVSDLGSSNGTFVDGKRIEADEKILIPPGATLSLGGVKFIVQYEPPASVEVAPIVLPGIDAEGSGSTVNFKPGAAPTPVRQNKGPAPEDTADFDDADIAAVAALRAARSAPDAAVTDGDAPDDFAPETAPDVGGDQRNDTIEGDAGDTLNEASSAASALRDTAAAREEEITPMVDSGDDFDAPEWMNGEDERMLADTIDAFPSPESVDAASEADADLDTLRLDENDADDAFDPEGRTAAIDPEDVDAAIAEADNLQLSEADEQKSAGKQGGLKSLFGRFGRKAKRAETPVEDEPGPIGDGGTSDDVEPAAISIDDDVDGVAIESEVASEADEFNDDDAADFLTGLNDDDDEDAESGSGLGDFLKTLGE